MFNSLINSIENTFVQFSFRRLMYIVFLLSIILGGLYFYNELTGYVTYKNIDGQLTELERLHKLEDNGIKKSTDLYPIWKSIVSQLRMEQNKHYSLRVDTDPIIKFISATLIGLIFIISSIIKMLRKDPDWSSIFVGALFFVLLLGIPTLFLPTWHSVWFTSGVYFIVQLLFIIIIGKIYKKK